MAEELTLTGATLTSEEDHVELTTSTSSSSHSHSHNHAACCAPSNRPVEPRTKVNMQELLRAPAADQFRALAMLIRVGSYSALEDVLKGFMEQSSDKDKNQQQLDALLQKLGDDGHSLVHWAAKRADDVRFLTLLCQHVPSNFLDIASQDNVGMRPLHWACTEGSIPHVSQLLKNNPATLHATDASGCTPLLIAAQYGHVQVVAYLLQRGADGSARDTARDTALHWAAYKGSVEVMGLLVFRHELSFDMADAFGQTPLHLASLRGHTSAVRYVLQECNRNELSQLLYLKDKNGKTPLDLAIQKNRPTVQGVLRDAMEQVALRQGGGRQVHYDYVWKQLQRQARELCSVHSWKIWMGCGDGQDEVDESPKFPFYFTVFTMAMALAWYPLYYIPVFRTSQGLLWDGMGWHALNLTFMGLMWFSFYKTYTTNPGTLDDASSHTPALRQKYEETLESYSDEASFAKTNETQLCHTCHVARPLRSKHCRVARRCVLLFDHHCPFVGNTIGLYNYKWFYLYLLFLTLAEIGFIVTLGVYVHRSPSIPLGVLLGGVYVGFFVLMAGGMLMYHTQLMIVNLTTNEHQNIRRYKYLHNEDGEYKNPFFRGALQNVLSRFAPSEASFTLPKREEPMRPLLNDADGDIV